MYFFSFSHYEQIKVPRIFNNLFKNSFKNIFMFKVIFLFYFIVPVATIFQKLSSFLLLKYWRCKCSGQSDNYAGMKRNKAIIESDL